jgi:hypothetical protein
MMATVAERTLKLEASIAAQAKKLAELKAKKARIEALARTRENASIRKARNRELFNAAGLLILAGLVDTKSGLPVIDRGELLGALLGLSKVSPEDPRRKEWKRAGDALIQEKST